MNEQIVPVKTELLRAQKQMLKIFKYMLGKISIAINGGLHNG